MRVLVSGAAGDVGLSIGKILNGSPLVTSAVGGDIHNEYFADDIFEKTVIFPSVSEVGYASAIQSFLKSDGIDVFIPTSEAELRWFSANPEIRSQMGVHCLMASPRAMQIGFDKLETARFIHSLGIQSPRTCSTSQQEEDAPGFPCVLKSRYGSGSRSVYLVEEARKKGMYEALFPDYIWQEFLPSAGGEHTCGVYRCEDGSTRTIIMRRRLAAGVTVYAEVIHDSAIEALCVAVAESLSLKGSINIQLRMVEGKGPMVFEINPRFSSTVGMRHECGFQDVIWSLQEQVLHQNLADAPSNWPAIRLARRYQEVVIEC
jgi:carbamoyl-phosphate synthase large subunit